jgi:hypothetical protein
MWKNITKEDDRNGDDVREADRNTKTKINKKL